MVPSCRLLCHQVTPETWSSVVTDLISPGCPIPPMVKSIQIAGYLGITGSASRSDDDRFERFIYAISMHFLQIDELHLLYVQLESPRLLEPLWGGSPCVIRALKMRTCIFSNMTCFAAAMYRLLRVFPRMYCLEMENTPELAEATVPLEYTRDPVSVPFQKIALNSTIGGYCEDALAVLLKVWKLSVYFDCNVITSENRGFALLQDFVYSSGGYLRGITYFGFGVTSLDFSQSPNLKKTSAHALERGLINSLVDNYTNIHLNM